AVDQTQLRELLGDSELRELLDAEAIDTVERQLQRLDSRYPGKTADAVHDLLLVLGDLSDAELHALTAESVDRQVIDQLLAAGRVLSIQVAGKGRYIAVEDA